jgi:signal transduction histidine kinase
MLSMAVTIDAKFEGFLVFDNYQLSKAFDDSDVRRLSRFREHAISAIAKARYLEDLQLKNREIVTRQKQLVMQEKMASLGVLTAGVAHEIKNPLNFITNFAELSQELLADLQLQIREQGANSDEVKELMFDLKENATRILEHGHRADAIVESMMALTRDTGRNRELTDLNKLIHKCVDLTVKGRARAAAKQPVQVVMKLQSSLPLVETVARNMGRVMVNILSNALDAMEEKTQKSDTAEDYSQTLEITTHQENNQVKIEFWDNGVGIQTKHLKEIFHPFFTTKSPGKGSIGLGLSVCYDIVTQENEGSIEVQSEYGSWTRVTITLNISE